MLVVRFLSGPIAGKIFKLSSGANVIGRSSSAKIRVPSADISKEHAKIDVYSDKVTITDLNSTNGTFVNGVRVQAQLLKPGDKIVLYKMVLEVTEVADIQPQPQHHGAMAQPGYGQPQVGMTHQHGNMAMNQAQNPHHTPMGHMQYSPEAPEPVPQGEGGQSTVSAGLSGFPELAKKYIDNVVLPGVYKLAEWMEFKWVLVIFMVGFIVLVTALSSIPLVRILKESIEKESQRRALTIARSLARVNRKPIMEGQDSVVSVAVAEKEPGVELALVVKSSNGSIIAPTRLAGQFSNISFVHTARKYDKESVGQIDSDTIVALAPINFYNPTTGNQKVQAFSVVKYDMGSLAINDARTLSLFIQTFFIALLMGALLFFFIYKLIEHPLISLNNQLDMALKEGTDNLNVDYEFPALTKLTTNINSALSRILSGSMHNDSNPVAYDRNLEMANLAQLVGFGSLVVNASDRTIATMNDAFAEKTHLSLEMVANSPISMITDQALKLSLEDLINRAIMTPDQLATNELDLGGHNFELAAQAVYGLDAVSYVIIALIPLGEEAYE